MSGVLVPVGDTFYPSSRLLAAGERSPPLYHPNVFFDDKSNLAGEVSFCFFGHFFNFFNRFIFKDYSFLCGLHFFDHLFCILYALI